VTDARHGDSRPKWSAPYARGTRVEPERSRQELERFLARRGASDFVVVQDDASARVRFALYGNYFELVLPLPDRQSLSFSHTPTGRPRSPAAQHRAYEQAVREKWRSLVLVTRGKLEAVESGISSVEQEFAVGYVPAAALNGAADAAGTGALRRVSRTIVGALGAGLLVPASALSALALPDGAVDRVAGVVWGDQPALFAASESSAETVTLPEPAEGGALVLTVPANDGAHFTLAVASPASGDFGPAPAKGGSSSGGSSSAGGAGKGGGGGGGSSSGSGSAGTSAGGGGGGDSGGGGGDSGGGDSGGGSTDLGGGSGGSDGSNTPPADDAPGNSEWGHHQSHHGDASANAGSGKADDKPPKSP
jgi:hypothetical protein